jgi:F0F1-type ATP synthase membrane subunit b/b'
MKKYNLFTRLACGLVATILTLIHVPVMAAETAPTTTELYRIIQEMRAELDAVKKQLAEERAQHANAPAVEQLQAQQAQIRCHGQCGAKSLPTAVCILAVAKLHNNLDAESGSAISRKSIFIALCCTRI